MKECNYGRIPPCYGSLERDIYEEAKQIDKLRAKLMEGGFSDDTHDKVYGVNKQMCDLGKTMNNPMKPLSEAAIQEIAKALEIIRNPKGIIMEEKKTIKEWKEAFAELYKTMRKELGVSDLDVRVCQNDVKPVVNFDIKF